MSSPIHIRLFCPSDAPQLAELFQSSVTELASMFYTKDQIRVWAARGQTTEGYTSRNQDGRITFVSVNPEGLIFAYAELETDGHIDHVYCRPSVAGTGLVSSLYDHLETHAAQLGLTKLYTEASEGARRFFLKKNFIDRDRIDFDIDGVTIHNYNMDKSI